MKYKNVKAEIKENSHCIITINRPEYYNAIDENTVNEIDEILSELEYNNNIRCVLVTGAGEKAFSSGGDLKKIRLKTALNVLDSKLQDLCMRIENFRVPFIAMFNGYALGGGMELAMACDFRIASKKAVFGLPELRSGLIPSAGGTQRLIRLVGVAKAKEIILLGEKINAMQARELGLVSEVVEGDQLIEAAERIINKLQGNSPMAVYLAKMSLNIGAGCNDTVGMSYEKMCQAVLMGHEDKIEGINAFFEKRAPYYEKLK